MLGGLGGGGKDDEGDPYNFDMGGGDDFGGFGQSDSFDDAPKRPSKKAPPKRPSSKAGRSLGPKPISSDVGTKTFKKASASDVLAKAQAMLSKAPTGSGQKEKRCGDALVSYPAQHNCWNGSSISLAVMLLI